jgi:hypothetical protein
MATLSTVIEASRAHLIDSLSGTLTRQLQAAGVPPESAQRIRDGVMHDAAIQIANAMRAIYHLDVSALPHSDDEDGPDGPVVF